MKNTVRRDWIKRQIENGNIEVKCNYILTDDYAWDNAVDFGKTGWMPARISNPKYEEYINPVGNKMNRCVDHDELQGYINFRDHDFKFKSGFAYKKEDGTIQFCPLSGQSYTLRIINQ